MTTDPDQDAPQGVPDGDLARHRNPGRKLTREERLADELRANLRRRKDQSRLRAAHDDGGGTAADAVPGDAARDDD